MTTACDAVAADPVDDQLRALMPLTRSRARHWERAWRQPPGELLTVAMMGAWDAVLRYDPDAGASLATFARLRIDGTIVDWWRREMAQQGGSRTRPSVVVPVDFTDLGRDDAHGGYLTPASLIEAGPGRTLEPGYERIDGHDLLLYLRVRMDPRDWDILARHVGGDETLRAVGASWGVTESRACQLLAQAIRRARVILSAVRETEVEQSWLRTLMAV